MPVTSSGLIRLSGDIVAEFGGTAPHALSEYYRGAGVVGSTNTNVPTTGALAFSDFYGSQAITNRDIRVKMSYSAGHRYSAFGVSSANSSAAPQSFSGSNSFSVYSPVFRAGTGYLGQNINFTMSQNEDAQATNIRLFGGTSATAVNDTVLSLNGAYNSSGGGSKSYRIVFDSAGAITSITQTGSAYNSGIISVATNNPNSNHRWYQWRVTSPSYADKGSTLIQGDPTSLSSVPQPA
jgi:hypothetical protein